MDSSSLKLPLITIGLVLALLLLLNLALSPEIPVLAAFVPALVWGLVLIRRGKG